MKPAAISTTESVGAYHGIVREQVFLAGFAEDDPVLFDFGVGRQLNLRAAVVAGHSSGFTAAGQQEQ